MFSNNTNSCNNNNSLYGYSNYRQSGGRMWGMSHSMPSGISRYAFSPQESNDYNLHSYFGGSSSLTNGRRGGSGGSGSSGIGGLVSSNAYDFSGGSNASGSNSLIGSLGNMMANASNNTTFSDTINNSPTNNSLVVGNNGVVTSGTNLIVNYLPQDMTDRELYALFRTVGPINTCRIMRDYKTGYSFGYAFVDFTSESDSQRAIKSLNGITVRNKRLKVSYARPGGESIKDTNLYVTNLTRTITDDQLETIFGKYGTIVQKNILRDKLTGKPRGVAFVRYNKREEAQEAIAALHNIIPEGGSQPLVVRLAEEHGKAKAAQFIATGNAGPTGPQISNGGGYSNFGPRDFDGYSHFLNDIYIKKHLQQQQQQQQQKQSQQSAFGFPFV